MYTWRWTVGSRRKNGASQVSTMPTSSQDAPTRWRSPDLFDARITLQQITIRDSAWSGFSRTVEVIWDSHR